MMTYKEAYEYINEINKVGSVLGLEVIRELLERLGNPQDQVKVVHIAGTNGKGSICAFLDSILEDAGYTVGRYISPTIITYLERFQINQKNMEKDTFAALLEKVKQAADAMAAEGKPRPTAFETETAIAFLYFLQEQVDVVLLETGMGGSLDATNVVKHPVCTILASISMDHMQFLGRDLKSILREKMGIMREQTPCIAYPMDQDLMREWIEKCEKMNCKYLMVDIDLLNVKKETLEGAEFSYRGEQYCLKIPGEYQIHNSLVAIETAKILADYNDFRFDLKYVNIYNGLKNTLWKGRFQKLEENPLVYVDGAHNEGGWRSLRDNILRYFSEYQIVYLCGVLADKEYHKMIELLAPYSNDMVVITPDNARALPKEALAKAAEGAIQNIYLADSVQEGRTKAIELSEKYEKPVVLIFGSLSFIGPLIEETH